MAPLLFVYGTLRPGQQRWELLRPHASSWADAQAAGRIWATRRGYPAAVFGDGGVIGGVAVTLLEERADEALRLLDAVEQEGTLFRRRVVVTTAGPAMAYEWMGSTTGFRPLRTEGEVSPPSLGDHDEMDSQ